MSEKVMRMPQKLAVGFLAGIILLGVVNPSQAADTTPMAPNPGPVGDFSWKGVNWEKRFWGGAPMYNGSWSKNNVSNPDANGYVTLNLTNPTGTAPIGAEMQTTRAGGWGYGTYSTTVEKNVNSLQKESVWGCLFTYDPEANPGFSEVDLCEASAWGGGAAYGESWPITQGHGYWFDASKPPGQGNNTTTFNSTNDPILTHKMVWEPGKITFETYAGEGYNGPLIKRTILQSSTVPVPSPNMKLHFNLWVTGGGGGSPSTVKPEKVVVRDFSYVPAGTTASAPTPIVTPTPTPTATVSPTPTPITTPTAIPTATATPTVTASPSPTATASPTPTPTATPIPTNTGIKLGYSNTKVKSNYSTKLTWSGATGSTVKVLINGVPRVVPNSGSYTNLVKAKTTTTYQIWDSLGCSEIIKVAT